jgi:hypothetical protein
VVSDWLNSRAIAMTQDIALATCSLARPAQVGGRVEIAMAEPARRVFPARLSAGLGICVKWGGSHHVTVNGRRASYPADSVAVRAPGVRVGEPGWHPRLPLDRHRRRAAARVGLPGTMAFVGRHSVPDLATVTRRLTRAESRLEGEEIVAGLVSSVVESGAVRSEGVRDEGGARGRRRCP